jgi:tRNA (guanine37-N1)-methyltransferase
VHGERALDTDAVAELADRVGLVVAATLSGDDVTLVDLEARLAPVDDELSIGDVELSGGEVAACVVIEAVTRLLDGAMGNADSPVTESFGASSLLEEPQFTRPAEFRGWEVPEVLRCGDHARIERWRHSQRLHRTLARRPDLIDARGGLSDDERRLLEEFPPLPYH